MTYWLLSLRLEGEARVGVMMNRHRGYIAAALGAIKAGCVYVPLDPTQPMYLLGADRLGRTALGISARRNEL